ncbi:MAG TPA: hypothetical protein VLG37_04630 [Candidatus Saccharimonadales bacterium]|nr:hypothetical protein [Candidatus Saccharimonadales bacterium]
MAEYPPSTSGDVSRQPLGKRRVITDRRLVASGEVDEYEIIVGWRYSKRGDVFDFNAEPYSGGIRQAKPRPAHGRLAVVGKDGRIYYAQQGFMVDVARSLRQRRPSVERLVSCDDIAIGEEAWRYRTEAGEFVTSAPVTIVVGASLSGWRGTSFIGYLRHTDMTFPHIQDRFREYLGIPDLQQFIDDYSQQHPAAN